jgi:hypothetical protein
MTKAEKAAERSESVEELEAEANPVKAEAAAE